MLQNNRWQKKFGMIGQDIVIKIDEIMQKVQSPRGTLELYEKTVKIHKQAYKKDIWSNEKYKIKTGHMIRSIFGHPYWTLKDLEDDQLSKVIDFCNIQISKPKFLPKQQ